MAVLAFFPGCLYTDGHLHLYLFCIAAGIGAAEAVGLAGSKIEDRVMNILFICDEYPPGRHGGIGTMTRALARGLVAEGHQVLVAGLYPPGYGEKDYEEDKGVKVWRRRMDLDIGWIGNNYSLKDVLLLKVLRGSGLMRLDVLRSARRFHAFILELIES